MHRLLSIRTAVYIISFALFAVAVPFFGRAATLQVDVMDSYFTPKNITVTEGDTILWTNKGSIMHTVTADNGLFNSGSLLSNQTFSQTFNSVGTYPYYCIPHGSPGGVGMSGTITVNASAGTSTAQPTSQGGLTVDAIRAQIESLIAQIDQLQRQLGATPEPGYVPPANYTPNQNYPNVVPATFDCPYISRSLKVGSTGDDVARLQQFLASDPSLYPEARVTGYYGSLTEAAIRRFQCKNKIVCDGTPEATGYGVTGPRTAALLALQCSARSPQGLPQEQVSGFIRVSPISGAAPLPVSVEVTLNTAGSCLPSNYELDFGDTTGRLPLSVPGNVCAELRQTFNHTYSSGGEYVVLLRSGTHQITANVSVSGSGGQQSGDTFSASPASGGAPLSVTFTGLVNSGSVCNAGPYSINFGDGQTATIQVSGCTPNTYSVTHVYTEAGAYAARMYRGGTEIGSASIAAGSGGGGEGAGSGGYFAVSPGVGGDVFTVEAEFELESSCARYDLDWGDGSSNATQSQGSCNVSGATKRLMHRYNDSGTYTLTLKRGTNLSSEDTAGVSIAY